MEKIVLVLCDIQGTIDGNDENRSCDYEEFNQNLLKLQDMNNVEYVIFSIFSSETAKVVQEKIYTLLKYFDPSIISAKNYFESGCICNDGKILKKEKGKIFQIVGFINEMIEKYDIEKVYYIDDCSLYHDFLKVLLEDIDIQVEHIIPKEKNGLKEVNELLSKHMENKFIK